MASVENARMGSDVRVAMDRAVFALDSIDFNPKPNGENMELKELAAAVKTLTTAMDEMSKDMKDMKEKAEDTDMPMEKMTKMVKDGGMYKDGMSDKMVKDAYDKMMKDKDMKKSEAMDSAISALQNEVKRAEI